MLIDHSLRVQKLVPRIEGDSPRPVSALHLWRDVIWPGGASAPRCYGLLDSTNIMFLRERLEASLLPSACLYDDISSEKVTATAPWLVELDPESRFTRELLTPAGPEDNPRHMLGLRPGILLLSRADMPTLRRHLRHYTVLRDEGGVGMIFRLQEPGFLPALLDKSSAVEIATFFRHVDSVIHWRPGFAEDTWELLTARAGADLPESPEGIARIPILGPVQRRALREALYERQAREMATRHADDPDERARRAEVYHRLLCSGYDGEATFQEGFAVIDRLPPDALLHFWRVIASEEYSLRFIILRFAGANGLQMVMS